MSVQIQEQTERDGANANGASRAATVPNPIVTGPIQNGIRAHVMTFRDYPPKLVTGLNV